ncbi:MAG: RluA family pseudouridine synthase [Oceanococcaceae bacterium]
MRMDVWLAQQLPQHSRGRIQGWIREGRLQVDGTPQTQTRAKLEADQQIRLQMPAVDDAPPTIEAEDIALEVLYEDADILVINKPAGLTVHPGAGQARGTLQNALLHYRPALAAVPRAGIVHRLDKLTSGLLLVAGSPEAHTQLVRMLAERTITREYLALVWGEVIAGGTIDAPLARDSRDRRRYLVGQGGRDAVTHFRVEERFRKHTLLRVKLETGRTHQIRVHMKHRKTPLVGDPVYGRRGDPLAAQLPRQALHAERLAFAHPISEAPCEFRQPVPEDMADVLQHLRDVNAG